MVGQVVVVVGGQMVIVAVDMVVVVGVAVHHPVLRTCKIQSKLSYGSKGMSRDTCHS